MPTLFIRFAGPATRTDETYRVTCQWAIREDDGAARGSGVTDYRGLSDLIDPATDWVQQAGNVVVFVPSQLVLCVTCNVPGRSVGQIRRALPFVVEEFVTTDIDQLHLASGELKRGAPARCSLIDRDVLETWLDCLSDLGLRPGYLVPEAEMLPVADRQATLLLDHDEVIVRTIDQAAAVDRENLAVALSSLELDRLLVVYGELTDMERGQLDPDTEVEVLRLQDGDPGSRLLYLAGAWLGGERGMNLLQGAYQTKQPTSPFWERWRPVAALAAAWVGLAFLGIIAQGIYASHRADELEASSEALYREIFPRDQRITNVRRQMQARLGDRSADAGVGFIDQLGVLGADLNPATSVMSLSYTDERDELAADLMIPGYEELDRLKQSLGSQGLAVDITSAEQQESGVRARLRISPQGRGQGA